MNNLDMCNKSTTPCNDNTKNLGKMFNKLCKIQMYK